MEEKDKDLQTLEAFSEAIQRIHKEVSKVIIGQKEIIDQLLIALFSRGNCLLIGVPGLAKTLMIRTLASAMDLKFSRIQFTPDLMPSDITGTEIIEENVTTGTKSFKFVKGPIFANIVLADEINRTPPKTQSALLEAMQEHEVTAAGVTYKLSEPFFVLATQNPIEQEGTYPLPEAQLDRFMFNLWLDYPNFDEEIRIVNSTTTLHFPKVDKVLSAEQIIEFQDLVRKIPVAPNVVNYAVKLVRATRPNGEAPKIINEYVRYGAGPRASQYLILGAKAKAAIEGRTTPDIDDVRSVALPVLRHRLVTNFNAEAENISTKDIVETLLNEIKI